MLGEMKTSQSKMNECNAKSASRGGFVCGCIPKRPQPLNEDLEFGAVEEQAADLMPAQ